MASKSKVFLPIKTLSYGCLLLLYYVAYATTQQDNPNITFVMERTG